MSESKNLKEIFVHLRERPVMYLGTNTITALYNYLNGYGMSFWLNNIKNDEDQNFIDNFDEFVQSYYEVQTTAGWCNIILKQSNNDEQLALKKFFELFDLFYNNVKLTESKRIVLKFLDRLIFEQDELKAEFGNDFQKILEESINLIKTNILTNIKSNYDRILEELNDMAVEKPELQKIILKLEAS